MAEYNIFEIIRSEKKSLSSVSIPQLNKVFIKYYVKYMTELYDKLEEDNLKDDKLGINFENNIDTIGNFIFHIFYSIYLTCFNIHISIFFLERASLLFFEFISLSSKEKEYKVESTSHINDAIIFTYKKTIGNVNMETILQENKKNKTVNPNKVYYDILKIRDLSFLSTKILNRMILYPEEPIDKFKKIYKNISELLLNIYLKIDIDKYLFQNINKLLQEYPLNQAIVLIRILLETINEFIYLDFFDFNNEESDVKNFINYLDTFFHNFISNTNLEQLFTTNDIKKNKIYMEFKENILRYISN